MTLRYRAEVVVQPLCRPTAPPSIDATRTNNAPFPKATWENQQGQQHGECTAGNETIIFVSFPSGHVLDSYELVMERMAELPRVADVEKESQYGYVFGVSGPGEQIRGGRRICGGPADA